MPEQHPTVPEPEQWFSSLFGNGRHGWLADGRHIVELPAVGSVPALRFFDARGDRKAVR